MQWMIRITVEVDDDMGMDSEDEVCTAVRQSIEDAYPSGLSIEDITAMDLDPSDDVAEDEA